MRRQEQTVPPASVHSQLHDRLVEYFRAEEIKTEKRLNLASLRVSAVTSIILVSNLLIAGSHPNHISNLIGYSIFVLHHLVLFRLLNKGVYRASFKYLSTAVNVTVISVIIAGYGFTTSWPHGLRSVTILFFFLMIVLSGLYCLPRLSVFACGLASCQYTGLFFYAAFFTDTKITAIETFERSTISWDVLAVVVALFLAVGFMVSALSKRIHAAATQSVEAFVEANLTKRVFQTYLGAPGGGNPEAD